MWWCRMMVWCGGVEWWCGMVVWNGGVVCSVVRHGVNEFLLVTQIRNRCF